MNINLRWPRLVSVIITGLIFSFIIVLKVPSTGKPFMADFIMGISKDKPHFSFLGSLPQFVREPSLRW